jgi:CSLREA domain-containing protein
MDIPPNVVLTATATDITSIGESFVRNDTSEFSPCVTVQASEPQVPDVLTVTTASDSDDGRCDDAHCSLREAIHTSNTRAGLDHIAFQIPGDGVHTIRPRAPLPIITDPVHIDGTSQPGYITTPVIELDGSVAGTEVNGLHITAGSSTVRGLGIVNFMGLDVGGSELGGAGIRLETQGGNLIVGNHIGTDPSGTTARGNENAIVLIESGANQIGGLDPTSRNLISGNSRYGILLVAHQDLPPNLIQGNYIGVGVDGLIPMGNADDGIHLHQNDVMVGGIEPGAGNIIAYNDHAGLMVFDQRTTIWGNAIFGNSGSGIDLRQFRTADEGLSVNDAGDRDSDGANALQNFPVLAEATIDGATTIRGSLDSAPNQVFDLEFFTNPTCDASGHGEGTAFAGRSQTQTDAIGQATFVVGITAQPGDFVTATATDPAGNTSEFSACVVAGSGPALVDGPPPAGPSAFGAIVVTAVQYDATLGHSIPNLDVTATNSTVQANFLDFYQTTGGITRWGLPTSEVFEETPGVLMQYYQRGILSWRKSLSVSGTYDFQRVLVWDFVGGGAGSSVDQGVEPGLLSNQLGEVFGDPAWNHRVSNRAIDGTLVGFLDVFNALGGIDSFGFPKTEARFDDHPDAVLRLPGSTPGFIRQYFQAAVMEYHPDDPPGQRVKLALLGDTVRNLIYPNDVWQAIEAFNTAIPLAPGQDLPQPPRG